MAIIQEHFEINGVDFIRTYSDAGRYVHGGVPEADYEEACDPAEFGRTYTEGGVIPYSDDDYAEAGKILMGVTE